MDTSRINFEKYGAIAVFRQETGEEAVLFRNPGESEEDFQSRVPEEWTFRRYEMSAAQQPSAHEARRQRLLDKHKDENGEVPEDFDVDEYMQYLDERIQEREDEDREMYGRNY